MVFVVYVTGSGSFLDVKLKENILFDEEESSCFLSFPESSINPFFTPEIQVE